MKDIRCAKCDNRLSRAPVQPVEGTTLLLCTNCGCAFSETLQENGRMKYRYLGQTYGNCEIREILAIKEPEDRTKNKS